MERRKVLLGSGTVFATVLAGCSAAGTDQQTETSDHTESDARDAKDDSDDNHQTETSDHTGSDARDEKDTESDTRDEKDDSEDKNNDPAQDADHDKEKKKQQDIPGFDRDEFSIDSDVIRVKELTYHKHRLTIQVMLTTTDRDKLVRELRALAPGFARAIHDADEFFAEVEEIKFMLYDAHKNKVFAFFLDIRWLREFLGGTITNDEFVERILDLMEQA